MNTLSANFVKDTIHSWDKIQNALSVFNNQNENFPISIKGLQGSSKIYFIREVLLKDKKFYSFPIDKKNKKALIVVSTEEEARELSFDIKTIFEEASVYIIPWWETLPYRAVSVSSPVFLERAASLSRLLSEEGESDFSIFIISQKTFLQVFPPPNSLKEKAFTLFEKQNVNTMDIAEKLASIGYIRVPRVHVKGEFSIRGEVLDIFVPGNDSPFRLIFDFDKISKIKTFDADSQVSLKNVSSVFVPPLKEVSWDNTLIEKLKTNFEKYNSEVASENLTLKSEHPPFTEEAKNQFYKMIQTLEEQKECEGEEELYPLLWETPYSICDYIKEDVFVFFANYDKLLHAEENIIQEYSLMYKKVFKEFPALPVKKMLISQSTLIKKLSRCVFFKTLAEDSAHQNEMSVKQKIEIPIGANHNYFGNVNFFKDELSSLCSEGWKIAIFCNGANQALRINQIVKEFTENGESVFVIPLPIYSGFTIVEKKLLVIQENEIFGRKKHISSFFKKAKSSVIDTFVELNPGDYIVHVQHGIGLFLGIERVKTSAQERDYIKIKYSGDEYIFVPVEQLDMVQRYIGNESVKPKLDTIGSKSWENRKNKVKQSVEEIANKLIDLYSRRKLAKGFSFPKDSEWQSLFEASFPYEDTDDQLNVTKEVKEDMEKDVPMDRLICGDVGYGKTEIALRAAFKACMGGKQVAFLCPTTILAEQHYETAVERFHNFPVKIARLSRFVSSGEQKKILSSLQKGEIDIVIGTHRIIQKDVVFKNLGLMIIDEEQRFGVKDKDKLKEIKTNVDCLSLSATPIPRTLHMSLLKIRDMSLLTTPPQNRQAIETVIEEYKDERVALAIRNEVNRGGQVFYLHNRVESLFEMKQKLERIVPEMSIEVAHGKMTSTELDDIFHRFKLGGFHVLISTTIIENGIDIPNVNTIIIDRADMYGVSQLYQLRGRVGRSDRKAYAYLLYPENKSLSEIALKRLQVISDFTELGSGFKIAMKDMEIRGAGNLLGKDQSGNVYAVGFDLYLRLLQEAIEKLVNQENYKEQVETILELEYTAFIPDSYVQNTQTKMEIYKKIVSIETEDDLYAVASELNDRFGDIPDEVASLLSLAEIRILCKKLEISSLKESGGNVRVTFSSVKNISIDKVLNLIAESSGTVYLSATEANVLFMKIGLIGLKEKSQFIYEKLSRIA